MGTANSIRREFERKMGESALAFILSGKIEKHEDERGWDDHWENGIEPATLCYWIGYACAKRDNATGLRIDEWIASHFAFHSGVSQFRDAYRHGHNARRNKGKKAA